MGFQTRRILVCICSLIMLIGLTGLVTEHQMIIADNWTSNEIQSGPEDSDSRTLSDYVPHGEIRIDSNAEFESQGWPGNGTQENPYIIEGFQIGSSIGIRIDRTSVFFVIRNCRLVSSGTGIYLARLGKGSIENCEIVGSYYGINLFFCENSTFVKNSIYDCAAGIVLDGAVNCSFESNTLRNCGFFSLYDNPSLCTNNFLNNTINGKPLGFFSNEMDLSIDGILYAQIFLVNCNNVTVEGGIFSNCTSGFTLINCTNCIIRKAMLPNFLYRFTANMRGINVVDSLNITIEDNYMSEVMGRPIFVDRSSYCIVRNNSVFTDYRRWSALHGIYFDRSHNCQVISNKVCGFRDDGIRLDHSTSIQVVNNTVYRTAHNGIEDYGAEDILVINNTVYNNGDYGIYMTSLGNNWSIYGNKVGWNSDGNARYYIYEGTSAVVYWDNQVDLGNQWHNYAGQDDYAIPGGGFDHYPTYLNDSAAPEIVGIDDLQYLWGTEQAEISWTLTDDFPSSYRILLNDVEIESEFWTKSALALSVGGLDIGVHNYTLIAYDAKGNSTSNSILVTVIPPLEWADEPTNLSVEFGASLRYDFNVTYPEVVDLWWLNDTARFSIDSTGCLRNQSILSCDIYGLTLYVNGTLGQILTEIITVTVHDTTPPSWDSLPENLLLGPYSTLNYTLNAFDLSGLDQWWVNDTIHFDIDELGTITNASSLEDGVLGLQIWVNDTFSNTQTTEIQISVDLTPPLFLTTPTDQNVEFGESFVYTINATDHNGLAFWWVNDTIHFTIDENGVLGEVDTLLVGKYGLKVWINDTLGNIRNIEFSVIVSDTTPPVWTIYPSDVELREGALLEIYLYVFDLSSIISWDVNDTLYFQIDATGFLTNTTHLHQGSYAVMVTVTDLYHNELRGEFIITVLEPASTITTSTTTTTTTTTTTPPDDGIMLLLVVSAGGIIIFAFLVTLFRKQNLN